MSTKKPEAACGLQNRLSLPSVTLAAATSVNLEATMRALESCLAQVDFAAVKLFTDAAVRPSHPKIEVVGIGRLASSAAYSDFVLTQMAKHIETTHCLVVQWDGFVLDARKWRSEFLDYDYIGASWPQFGDGHDVGNGGFSLRSRRLMEASLDPRFQRIGAEDVAIGRINRKMLEAKGMRIAPRYVADQFAAERAGDISTSFGFHGVFNMPAALGVEAFWQTYCQLDEHRAVRHDFGTIIKAVSRGRGGVGRATRLIVDRLNPRIQG